MARVYRFVVGSQEAGLRLDHYLVRHLPIAVSRSAIQRVVREGGVTIGDAPIKANQRLRAGDVVLAQFDQLPAAPTKRAMTPQAMPLEIVHEDAHLLVVNKPAGLVTHPAPGHWDGTLVNGLLWHLAQGQRAGESVLPRAGIVHRLDKETSGLLLAAKTDRAHAALAKQMKARAITRQYLAIVEGSLPMDRGTVDAAIGRHAIHRKEMTIRHLGGRAAVTHYRVLKRFALTGPRSPSVDQADAAATVPCSLIAVALETGRTHQIRVHMAHLGYPVAGDTTYGKHAAGFWQRFGMTRQMLHAYRLRFEHPVGHRPMTLCAPIPEDMAHWITQETIEKLATSDAKQRSVPAQRGRRS